MSNLPSTTKRSRPKLINRPSLRRLMAVGILAGLGLGMWAPAPLMAKEAVLLRTGAVLQGDIDNHGLAVGNTSNAWAVIKGDNREVRIRSNEILARAPNLLGLYHWQRAQYLSSSSTAADHLRLADWCLRYQLWPEASRELLDAKQLSPNSGRLALLERRLQQLSSTQPKHNAVPPSSQQIAEAETLPKRSAPAALPTKPADQYPVQTAAFEQAIEEPSLEKSAQSKLQVSEADLTHFSRKIQPLLVNNCTESGCHRQGSAERFTLDVSLLHGYGDMRSTQSNLREILSAIDPTDPTNSPLLTAARGPHAGISPFVGPRREEWLERLEAWVTQVSGTAPTATKGGELAKAERPIENQTVQSASFESNSSNSSTSNSSNADLASADEMSFEQDYLQPADAPIIGGQLKQVAPRDEFDPELFNRKYRRPEDDLPPAAG